MRLTLAAVAVLTASAYLLGLSEPELVPPDEPREAEIARELREDPLRAPRLNGEPHVAKPPLVHWLVAGAFAASGEAAPGERAARIVPALFALAMAFTTFLLGRGWFSTRHGALAALLVLLTPHVLEGGRRLSTDPALACFVTIAVGSSLTTLRAVRGRKFLLFLSCAGLGIGLGFLAKGPVAAALALFTMTAVIIAERGVRGLFTLRALAILGSAVLFLAPAAALWHWILWKDGGWPLVQGFWDFQRAHAFPSEAATGGGALFYLEHGLAGFLPWLIFAPFAGVGRSHKLAPGGQPEFPLRHLAAWAIVPVVFLSFVAHKREVYLLPVAPPIALLAAAAILEPPREGLPAKIVARLWQALSTAVLAAGALGPLIIAAAARFRDAPIDPARLVALVALGPATLYALTRDAEEREAPLRFPFATAGMAAVLALLYVTAVEPLAVPRDASLRPLAREVAAIAARRPDARIFGYGLDLALSGALPYEMGRTLQVLRTADDLKLALEPGAGPAAIVVLERRLYERAGRPGARILAELRGGDHDVVVVTSQP